MPRSFSRSFESITRSGSTVRSSKRAGLLEQLVDQRGLAVVDVRDDGDVSEPFLGQHGGQPGGGEARIIRIAGGKAMPPRRALPQAA